MSDFDFIQPATESDPAAEFLAREQSELGGLDDDFAFEQAPSADVSTAKESSETTANFPNDDFSNVETNQEVCLMIQYKRFIRIFFQNDVTDLANGLSDLSVNKTSPPSSFTMNQPIVPTEEPESIKKWREENEAALAAKDAQEAEKIEELRQQGKKELEEWYENYLANLATSKQQNRYVRSDDCLSL